MATNNILFATDTPVVGSRVMNVAAAATTINPGEPVAQSLGAATVTAMATNKPVVGTDYLVGIAATTSTQTASAAGTVQVVPLVPGQTFLMSPNSTAAFDTQAEYDALVGDRVLIDLTGTTYTLLATDGSTYGCVILPMLITENPGKVLFTFRNAVSYLS